MCVGTYYRHPKPCIMYFLSFKIVGLSWDIYPRNVSPHLKIVPKPGVLFSIYSLVITPSAIPVNIPLNTLFGLNTWPNTYSSTIQTIQSTLFGYFRWSYHIFSWNRWISAHKYHVTHQHHFTQALSIKRCNHAKSWYRCTVRGYGVSILKN